ncbi:hypothetical protein A3D00_02435 [Candidatus Woesebacteria bacterium RIFCSPHIGHO2_02_FULL_38_9]|uniref:Phosphodiester glycosidase domain-containing protein n=1 Tax=Candidatus Woesebacteria bacterium RIFCSPHIGHO2_01_FULL_39_28 TaxID=1802496 RepID=A0A1F7YBJ9_9BACT|nr:MAG: hypothetical protein A2627_02695 [Candidatus Woesebacteria bacterium RIFCSPHIGHO2_01_FULL_39_28]OGM31581.1 MAG: hypothetical protein A3D00_02435 [Candidatus Woesebacteria bacterium RIFCSPHIGHO2_02_FULL_38_9]OGM58411.1 MAG: hypothetical protein A3A50_02620 [Candidatus Woesebacteria bacterium RIFCSPLOWO2_01_FULL_38_20]
MKKIIIALLFVIFVSAGLSTLGVFRRQNVATPASIINNPTPTEIIKNKKYKSQLITVDDPSGLYLYPNYEEQANSKDLINKNSCKSFVNAGFYSKDSSPLGLLISQGKLINKDRKSELFNGYFSVTSESGVFITDSVPRNEVRIALQSGPILIKDFSPQILKLKQDEEARRVVVATDKSGKIYFMVFYSEDSFFSGPFLKDLPQIVEDFERDSNLKFDNALNLDGGSASAFYSEDFFLSELNHVGSFFCILE